MSVWRDYFTEYTTATAFSLTLSHNQASLLIWLVEKRYQSTPERSATGEWYRWRSAKGVDTFISTFHALEKRGLAEHNPVFKFDTANKQEKAKAKWVYRPTPAGRLVYELLRLADIAAPQPNKKEPSTAEGE